MYNEPYELKHYGTPRHSGRYPYGSGKRPYQSFKKVFISGSSKTQSKDSEYYRPKLSKEITKQIDNHIKEGNTVLVGDAPGIDRQVQDYLKNKKYKNVVVYATGENPRYISDKKWNVKNVDTKGYKEGTKEFNRQKDIAMTNDSDIGLSIILENGGASATRNNINRLINQNKDVKVYMLQSNKKDHWVEDIIKEISK